MITERDLRLMRQRLERERRAFVAQCVREILQCR